MERMLPVLRKRYPPGTSLPTRLSKALRDDLNAALRNEPGADRGDLSRQSIGRAFDKLRDERANVRAPDRD